MSNYSRPSYIMFNTCPTDTVGMAKFAKYWKCRHCGKEYCFRTTAIRHVKKVHNAQPAYLITDNLVELA